MSPKIYGFFFSTANLTCIHEEQVSEKTNQENDMHFEGKMINTTKQWKIPPIYQRSPALISAQFSLTSQYII